MDDNEKLSGRQLRVSPHLLAAPSIEEGCKRAGVSKAAVYQWLGNETFRQELKRQRDEIIERALDSERENISIRAAESIIEFAQKALEHEELEQRIEALETRLAQQGGNYR